MGDFPNRTNGPWKNDPDVFDGITAPDGSLILNFIESDYIDETNAANADFIVHACNNHDRLTTELAQCREALDTTWNEALEAALAAVTNELLRHSGPYELGYVVRSLRRAALANKVQP